MANTLSKINNCNSIITQNQSKESEYISFNQGASTSYRSLCEWFGIENCINSQIWFFGTFSIAIMMLLATYLTTESLYGF
ncbi:Uncharacterized protein BTT61001_06294 [Bacillus thuringiensis]|uniref:DUF3961 domain-containing protein n=1 Tax=Bacillus thuringiensis TaxID=1428 RepID=A0A1C4GP29_BACTU|nr:hypothetical protein BK729_05620 [Bacillus thuringiensis serovar wratislaviensis]SCC69633.1 Uncharacterized protein BTT61001_06294 [Bacillus thuringiensis]